MLKIEPAAPHDGAAIEALLDDNFGSDRHQRTAYRLREGATPIIGPTLVLRDGKSLCASVQFWPIELVAADGTLHPLTLLGPIVVAKARHGAGLGSMLMRAALAVVDAQGLPPVLLIGDADYYGRFGFSAIATGGWDLPGPFDAARLLLRAPAQHMLPMIGMIRSVRRRPLKQAA